MFRSVYPFHYTFAILFSILLLTSCGGGSKKSTLHINLQHETQVKAANQAEKAAKKSIQSQTIISQLAQQARLENPETFALDQLFLMSKNPSLPTQDQGKAALQYAELLFEFERPDAFTVCQNTLKRWGAHTYAPHTHFILAEQWMLVENYESAITSLTAALLQPNIDHDALLNIIDHAQPLLDDVSEQSRIAWMLAVSLHDTENTDFWLQQAARLSTLESVMQLRHSEHPLHIEQANFYRYIARERLMVGDYHAVRMIARILKLDMPDSEVLITVQHWAESEGEISIIGVLLPLSGQYATYGQQALQGIRLAASRPEFEDRIILHIQDTAGDINQTISSYHQLLAQGVQWVIGPLLSNHTASLVPYLNNDIPVISLSNQVKLAAGSPSLFIHSLAKTVQANFMAHYAINQGKQRMVIIYDHANSTTEEANAFAQTFTDAGGEIIDTLELRESVYDNRPDLVAMRSRTDDELLLAQLDEDLNLFSPEREMDIILPLNMDAIYIATTGKKLAVLAGQMAYSDISQIQLYGSHRWYDGHLMDDKGRYLNNAQFSTPFTSLPQPDQAVLDVQNQYRVTWAKDGEISPLFALAYDATMNVAALGSRVGLSGKKAIQALNTTSEFPAISGNYYFNQDGISQKTFAIQSIQRGRIKTLKTSK